LQEVLKIVNQIASTSGRNDKETILKKNQSNEKLKDVFYFIYNTYILTGLSTKKINKKTKEKGKTFDNFEDMKNYILKHNTGTDHDIATVQNFIKNQPIELQDFYKKVFTKDLKIGITSGTLNKIYGKDFIPEFAVLLAEKYLDYADKINQDIIITEKKDGNRNIALVENNIKMFTRQGQVNQGFLDIEEELKLLPKGYAYDGEFIAVNNDSLNSADLYRITTSIVRKDGVKKNIIFHIFDMIPIEDFKNGICKITCIDRKLKLKNVLEDLKLKWIQEVPMLYIGKDKKQIIYWLDELTNRGLEGCMVNIADAPYECKRSKNLLKCKKFADADVLVTDILEGTGKYINKLGAIKVKFESDGQYYESEIGTGFSDQERELYWKNPELLLNHIVKIGYFEISKNKNGTKGLRFGTWKSIIRKDKNNISMF